MTVGRISLQVVQVGHYVSSFSLVVSRSLVSELSCDIIEI